VWGDGVSLSRTFLEACFGETPKPTREMRALPRTEVALITDLVRFVEPGGDVIVNLINALEANRSAGDAIRESRIAD
jgi:hypothetical protein